MNGRTLSSASSASCRSACRLAVRVLAEPQQHGAHHVGRILEHRDAAILEFRGHCRIEHQPPAVHRRVGHDRLDLRGVEADAGRAPHVHDTVLVARVVAGSALQQLRVEVGEVRQLRLVELPEYARLDLALEEVGARHHDVVARVAGEQLGLEHLVAVEHVVADLDPGLLLEVLDHGRVDVVRPVVDVEDLVLGGGAGGTGGRIRSRLRGLAPATSDDDGDQQRGHGRQGGCSHRDSLLGLLRPVAQRPTGPRLAQRPCKR